MNNQGSRQKRVLSKKICMLGTFGVGKTSLVRQFVHGIFEEKYLSTIGVQISQKVLENVAGNNAGADELRMILWDLANIEKFTPAIQNYFRGTAGAIVVVDLTRSASFDPDQIHLKQFRETNPRASIIVVGNKSDLIEKPETSETVREVAAFAKSLRAPHFFTSAKTGEQVEATFTELGGLVLNADG